MSWYGCLVFVILLAHPALCLAWNLLLAFFFTLCLLIQPSVSRGIFCLLSSLHCACSSSPLSRMESFACFLLYIVLAHPALCLTWNLLLAFFFTLCLLIQPSVSHGIFCLLSSLHCACSSSPLSHMESFACFLLYIVLAHPALCLAWNLLLAFFFTPQIELWG